MGLKVPARVAENARRTPEGRAWLNRLPETLRNLEARWLLTVGDPFDHEDLTGGWVAPVTLLDGSPAVLKLRNPHMEGEHEIQGLRFWAGDPTVRLLEADQDFSAMLLERCLPGTRLRERPETEQDQVIAGLLKRLWRRPLAPHSFRPLSVMTKYWSDLTLSDAEEWPDAGLVREGLRLFDELPRTAHEATLLATDLHAGNVLQSERMPWLVIDPKPFVGDPAYDPTQHLFNCVERLRSDPDGMFHRMGDLLDVDHERVRLWTFARAAAEPRDDWHDEEMLGIARAIAP
ncbi:MAG TPA: aminoglycoside phosphotransferase family protein [Terriglobia bacterium]|nr:aminoglycoside phosphotransferase family protein [Terriglobia bacterium]